MSEGEVDVTFSVISVSSVRSRTPVARI